MTELNKEMSNRKIGQRFKELIKEFDGKQEITAMHLNYSKTSISRFCSGKERLPDEAIKKVAKKWGVREEYIKRIDDYKTEIDLMSALFHQSHDDFKIKATYLSTLGFKINFAYWLTCPAAKYEQFKDELEPLIQIDSCNIPLCFPLEDEVISDNPFLLELFSHSELETLVNKNYMSIYLHERPTELLTQYFNKIYTIPTLEKVDLEKDYCGITVGYIIEYNGLTMNFNTIDKLKNFFDIIDSHSKCCIQLFMSGKIN